MDALLVHGKDGEPGDTPVGLEARRDVADDVLNEDRIVVGLHSDMALVLALEQRVDGRGSRLLGDLDEFFDPDQAGLAAAVAGAAGLDGDHAALVMRPVVADRLAAGAEALDGGRHREDEVDVVGARLGDEGALVVHQGGGAGDRGGLLDEVREAHLDVGALGLEVAAQLAQQRRDCAHRDLAAVAVEHLDEAAHVRPLEVVGEAHREGNRGDGVLALVEAVEDDDRVTQIAGANAVDRQAAVVGSVLDVGEVRAGGGRRRGGLPRLTLHTRPSRNSSHRCEPGGRARPGGPGGRGAAWRSTRRGGR